MKIWSIALSLMLLVGGCKMGAIVPSPQATAAQSHLDQIKTSATDVKNDLEQAQGALDRKEVQSAETEVTQAAVSVDKIPPLVDQTKAEAQSVSDERDQIAARWNEHKDDLSNYKKAHENDWLGPRAHRWMIWICVIVGLLGTGYVFLMAAGEMEGGALAGAINVIGHLMTFGLKFLGTLLGRAVAWLLGKIGSAASGAVSMLEKAAPNQPATSKPATAPA